MQALSGKTVVVGVGGGIAGYKAAELIRVLVAREARVRPVMSRNASHFITALTLQTLSGHPVATDTFSLTEESQIGHIQIAEGADVIVVAPATADLIGKAACGIADDVLTTVLLAARCPVAFAPAMNVNMYANAAVVENLARLRQRGAAIIEPDEGSLACGAHGVGRLAEPAAIADELERIVSNHDLRDERILVTAGPTQEAIDPVRMISNRSSGKMGFALAREAWRRGAQVRLIAGPSALAAARGVQRIDSTTAAEMLAETSRNFPWCSALVMAAAVADYRPAKPALQKIRKSTREFSLELIPIPDELPRIAGKKGNRIVIGFAAETEEVEKNAFDKLVRKKLDLIVANDVSRKDVGFGADTNAVTILYPDGRAQLTAVLPKNDVANLIFDELVALRAAKNQQHTIRAAR